MVSRVGPRVRKAGFWAAVACMVVAALVSLFASFSWIDRPYPGFKVRIDHAVEQQLPPYSTGAKAGLLPGDRVIAVDGSALDDPRDLYAYVEARPVGTPVTYEFRRVRPDGGIERFEKTIATQLHGARLWASTFLALWLTGVCFLVLGAGVSALKPGDPLARANLVFHLAGAASCLAVFDQSTTFLSPLTDPFKLLPWAVAVLFMNLALQFPLRHPRLEGLRRWHLVLGLAGGAGLVLAYQVENLRFWVTFSAMPYIALGQLVLIANALGASLSHRTTPRQKGQGRLLLVGMVVSIVPALLVPQAQALGLQVNLAGLENFALPLWPLVISYAIVRHRLFDIRPLIQGSATYLLAAALLAALYVAVIAGAGAVVGGRGQLPGLVATVLVAIAFAPVRDGIRAWLDARFFRSPYRFNEVIAAFTRSAQEAVDAQVLMRAYLDALDGALSPARLAIVIDREGPTPVASRGAECEALLVQPLMVQARRLGHVEVGAKKSELEYTALDRALVRELTQLLAVWLDWIDRFDKARAQSQEIEALKRSEAMQGQFLNVVSHELKIPLSVMLSSINLLEKPSYQHDDRTRGHLNRIRRSLTQLSGLVGDLLHAGQLQSGHFHLRPRAIEMGAIAHETVAELRSLAENKDQTITLAADAPLPVIHGDGARLSQVLRNMIHNAVRYTPAGGRIEVRLAPEGDGVRIEVQDDGPGLEAAAVAQLFQRFGRVHAEDADREQGVGLGLFICKAIVEAHGGHIGVESLPGAGATFWFTLPPGTEAAREGAPGAVSEPR